jgi:hypothetical protein
MLHFKLKPRWSVSEDPMGRTWVGYDPNRTPEVLFEQNRGVWRLGPRADNERYALFSSMSDHTVKFIAEIEGFDRYGPERAVVGRVLPQDHPLHERYVGMPAPDRFRNPVTYVNAPDTPTPTCMCSCGARVETNRSFLSGHDQRAVHARITKRWGSTVGFIDWFDREFPDG